MGQGLVPRHDLALVQEHEIDVAERVKFRPAITADGHQRELRKFLLRLRGKSVFHGLPHVAQQDVHERRARPTDFQPTRARAVQYLQPVGFHLEKGFIPRQFLRRQAARRQHQTAGRVRFHLLNHCCHRRKTLVANPLDGKVGAIVRNLAGSPVFVRLVQPMSVNADPDAALMLRVKRGDAAAFGELVDKYKQPVMNLTFRILRDGAEAEDLAQNVFLQVYKSAHRYEASARFTTWLFTIARNLCFNEIRRRTRHPADSLDASVNDDENQAPRQYEDTRNFFAAGHAVAGRIGA